jgi:hypothetical protein
MIAKVVSMAMFSLRRGAQEKTVRARFGAAYATRGDGDKA